MTLLGYQRPDHLIQSIHTNLTAANILTNKMMTNINMLRTGMHTTIHFTHELRSTIIGINCRRRQVDHEGVMVFGSAIPWKLILW